LKIGSVLGTRTWGGDIWLSFDNFLLDKGIASSAEMGVFDHKGAWSLKATASSRCRGR